MLYQYTQGDVLLQQVSAIRALDYWHLHIWVQYFVVVVEMHEMTDLETVSGSSCTQPC